MIIAIPWPPPTHIVSNPMVLLSVARPFKSVHRMRAPVIPNGWPSAIAPPCGLSLSLKGSTPSSRAEGMTWAAKASLISTMSMSSIVIFARLSAWREASIGPSPMISGSSAATPVALIRASGRKTTLFRLACGGRAAGSRPIMQRTGIARGDAAVFAEGRLQRGQHLHRCVGPRPVVPLHGRAIPQRHRDDLAIEEPAVARLDRPRLALAGGAIHFLAADVLAIRDILRRLSHRDIDVGVLLAVASLQSRVLGIGLVGESVDVPRDAFHPDRAKGLAFARLDGMEGHPAGLERRCTVTIDGCARNVEAGQDTNGPSEVEARFTGRQTATADQVIERRRVELRDLLHDLARDVGGQVVGPHLHQRPLIGAANRRAAIGNDHRIRHDEGSAYRDRSRCICRRIVVPLAKERSCTRSQSWLASHSPRPPSRVGAGRRRSASGSSKCPRSRTSQKRAAPSRQTRSVPEPPPCCTLLVATSLAASTRSAIGRVMNPALAASLETRRRTAGSPPTANTSVARSAAGSGNGLS